MATTPDDVLKLIKDKEVKFVDLRFTDTRGKEQHVTVPVKYFNKEKFEEGHAFDGSSIAGWKEAYNVLEGFEGDKDAAEHRNTVGGWRKAGLPWVQS